jgi:hypothetical protein
MISSNYIVLITICTFFTLRAPKEKNHILLNLTYKEIEACKILTQIKKLSKSVQEISRNGLVKMEKEVVIQEYKRIMNLDNPSLHCIFCQIHDPEKTLIIHKKSDLLRHIFSHFHKKDIPFSYHHTKDMITWCNKI